MAYKSIMLPAAIVAIVGILIISGFIILNIGDKNNDVTKKQVNDEDNITKTVKESKKN